MELEFSRDQEELRDSIRAVLVKESPVALARSVVETGEPADALWATMTELGWPALTTAEEHGGIGLGAIEAGILAEELGRVMAPGPLLATVTQYVPIVRETADAEQQAKFLGAVARGEVRGALALSEASGSSDPAAVTATATPDGDGYVLHGTKRFAIEARGADELAVVVRLAGTEGDDGITVVVVPGADVTTNPIRAIDGSRAIDDVVLDGVRVGPERVLGSAGDAASAVRRALEEAVVALALETVGTCQTIFDVTLDYAKSRHQFGVPIGSFQAIKHKFADMVIALERARATGYFAALTLAEDDERRTLATAVAKAAAGDCQHLLGKEGIQIHGGIGYTWEHDVHLYVKRAKSNDAFFGGTSEQRSRIADRLFGPVGR
ncbi:MAG TPA: acyl-CoA dehydrogenase family protein [Acidimicrobiia bacterium]|nr:acyl-CoA dehydrogenase family protein [Acidimicrobiia bacterium]